MAGILCAWRHVGSGLVPRVMPGIFDQKRERVEAITLISLAADSTNRRLRLPAVTAANIDDCTAAIITEPYLQILKLWG